ncbi:GNAT family N-acetyltransferase [Exilibacterium tricleocarpae]|uniref:GNAT family N-acetyltransferase n=1 Tax=Exilibacterium tricleocarpae TaxID=2591008 RepID=A0A545U3V8_9GAMM|nr:GNAT family N-acetyltransferase [Exilibacterium tricleocarpae]TQV84152.1 GNAT family N-acetyltransferase [Exilibacterium tricleocarpae]
MTKNHYIYETQRIGVKGLTREELEGAYPHWLNDQAICAFNSHGIYPASRASAAAFIDSLQGDRNQVVWAVYHKGDHCHIGNLSLQAMHWINRSAEIAFLFGARSYWGQGYAEEAARLLLRHGFRQLNLHRIYCATAASNTGMRRLAEKLGMCEEGTRRQALYLDGRYVDAVEFGLLCDEFAG